MPKTTRKPAISAAALTKFDPSKLVEVELHPDDFPDGGYVYLRERTAATAVIAAQDGGKSFDMAKVLALAIVDEKGDPLFSDASEVSNIPGKTFQRIMTAWSDQISPSGDDSDGDDGGAADDPT